MASKTKNVIGRGIDFVTEHSTGIWLAIALAFIVFTVSTGSYWLTIAWVFIGGSHLCDWVFDDMRGATIGLILSLLAFVFLGLSFFHPL